MFYEKRRLQHERYGWARDSFLSQPDVVIRLECYVSSLVNRAIEAHYEEIERDYNEASYLHAFWAGSPPENRGRAPVGDQIPWMEVGEHSVGHKLTRLISQRFEIHEIGLPSGADNRFVLVSDEIAAITRGLTDRAFVFLDIKSVGPRDHFPHTVLSPYQVSGDGIWNDESACVTNSPMLAAGRLVSHPFYPAIAPLFVFSDGRVAPAVHLFLKPVYRMLGLSSHAGRGQPLESVKSVCVPNGLLLALNPHYLQTYPGLFFPGKDDQKKAPAKTRVRVSFALLRQIADWRVCEFSGSSHGL